MTVLGISIGTTRAGVCVLKDGVLLDRHMHNYNSKWSHEKLKHIISGYRKYLNRYQVTAVVIKIPRRDKQTNGVLLLMSKIEALAREYGCEFDLTTKDEIKHRLTLNSTNDVIEFAKQLYPELSALYEKGNPKNDRKYYKRLFEAVLAAYIYQQRQRK